MGSRKKEDEYVMINMDLEKAYDRVGWEYLLPVVARDGPMANFCEHGPNFVPEYKCRHSGKWRYD